ncbi:MAG: hypothetical protein JST11_05515 [Acidobacteria bacterium]|nr:hypothetical protein [Acidobacteriota bacterium]
MREDFISVALLISSSALFGQVPSLPQQPPDSILAAVKAAYQREFGETIEHPAVYNNPRALDCRGEGHLTTTAYLKAGLTTTLLSMYMSRDGVSVIRKDRSQVLLAPAGTIRVLVVLVRYPETVTADALGFWEDAQKQINEDHMAFAKSRGYKAPVVTFDNTNIVIDPDQIDNPHSPASVRMAAEHHGLTSANYQIVMVIDINPRESAGGLSINSEKSVYVGNYSHWKTPLGAREWKMIARTAYHHEVAHHWGWPATHDWAGACGGGSPEYAPFIAPPILFGWEDLQGKQVPEILSETPYGRVVQ